MQTNDTEILLAVMAAVAGAPEDNEGVCQVLDRRLGRGWLREYVECRSYRERLALLRRRNLGSSVSYAKFAQADSLASVTSFEDGGAR